MIYAPLVLVTALVSARSGAEWIPDVSVISDSVVDQRLLADGRRRLRAHDGATEELNEERVGTPPHLDSEFLASSMRKGESSADTLVPNLGSTMPSLTSVTVPLSSNVQMKKKQRLRKQIYRLNKRDDVDPKVKDKLKALAKDPGSLGKTKEELLKRAEDAVIDDMDPKIIDKLQALAKDPGSIGKTREELLKSAEDAVIDDKLNRLKSDKSFTQRMAQLGFNVGDAKVAVQWLRKRLWFLKYDDHSLYLMALGSEYFKEAESLGANIEGIDKEQLLKSMGKYAYSDEFKRWKDRRKDSLRGVLEKVYGKMSLLKCDEHLKSLECEELANMAFGSELFKMSEIKLTFPPLIKDRDKIETLDLLDQLDRPINQLPNGGNSGPDVKQKVKDVLKEDPKTSIGKTAKQLKRKAIDEASGVPLDEETNEKAKVA